MNEFGKRLKGLRIEKGYSLDMVVYDLSTPQTRIK